MAKGKYEYWLTPDGLTLLRAWARDGLPEQEIAKKIGISFSTYAEWKKRFPEISEALKKNREIFDSEVEDALYKSIKGYFVDEEKTEIFPDGSEKVTKTHRWIAPDTTAQIFWLKCRKSHIWRDKPKDNADKPDGVQVIIDV